MNAIVKSTSTRTTSYAELQDQLHRDLRAQHPEWIEPDGRSSMCDWYDRRFAELISFFQTANAQS